MTHGWDAAWLDWRQPGPTRISRLPAMLLELELAKAFLQRFGMLSHLN
jgi:hypothetical protein